MTINECFAEGQRWKMDGNGVSGNEGVLGKVEDHSSG